MGVDCKIVLPGNVRLGGNMKKLLFAVVALLSMVLPIRAEIIASGNVQISAGSDPAVKMPAVGTKTYCVIEWTDCFFGTHYDWMNGQVTDVNGGYECTIDETGLTGFWQVTGISFDHVNGYITVTAGDDTVHTTTGDYAISQSTITQHIIWY